MSNKLSKNCITYLFFLILISGMASCSLTKSSRAKDYYLHLTPPNGVRISENLYFDQTEITNIDYREYMWWTKRILGAGSEEYLAAIPDTNVWKAYDSCLATRMGKYLWLREFEDFPVVGITRIQAEMYSKWRSDRVFEYILIKYGKIKMDTAQNRDSYFSIESYYNGTYHNQPPDPGFKYYPEYRLPNPDERKLALHYADSVEHKFLQKTNSKKYAKCKNNMPEFQAGIVPCINDSFMLMPVRKVRSGCVPLKYHPLYNMRGNVSEWTAENDISAGGGWVQSRQEILASKTFQSNKQNAWTGFRNVCQWKEYRKGK